MDEPLSSLFVHVFEPYASAADRKADPRRVVRVEKLELLDEDDESAAVRIHKADGTADVWLVRLTPPTEGYNATLPLAQPEIAPVETADGAFRLEGHVGGVVEGAGGSKTHILVGGTGSLHVDRATPAPGARVFEGFVTGMVQEGYDFYLLTSSSLPTEGLEGEWILVSMGQYAHSSTEHETIAYQKVRKTIRCDESTQWFYRYKTTCAPSSRSSPSKRLMA